MAAQKRRGRAGVIVASVAAVGGGVAIWQRQLRSGGSDAAAEPASRWRSVTINAPADRVMPDGQVPGPLAALGDLVEVEMKAAPGSKGTELRARLKSAEPAGLRGALSKASGHDPRQEVRSALREAKQLIEVGEVLKVEPMAHGRRPATPGGKLVEVLANRAPAEGIL